MQIKIPKTFMGKPIAGSLEKVLATNGNPINPPDNSDPNNQNPNLSPISLKNPQDYILLPSVTHGNFAYADTLVSMYKLGMSPEVEQVGRKLGYQLGNTAKESNGRDYIGNINQKQALTLNLSLGGFTLSPRRFADFLLLLKSGNAVDGSGQRVPQSKLTEILNEITEVRNTWRSEWLDGDFKYLDSQGNKVDSSDSDGKLYFYSGHKLVNGVLVPNYKERLESCLMIKGKGINLSNFNDQGMPTEEGTDFKYWCPDKDNNSVARFVADSGGACLGCDRVPSGSYPALGVRYCVPKACANF